MEWFGNLFGRGDPSPTIEHFVFFSVKFFGIQNLFYKKGFGGFLGRRPKLSCLSVAADDIFVGVKLVKAHRSASVKLLR